MLLKAPGDLGGLFLENVSPAAAFVLAMSVIAAVDQILKRSIRSDKGQRWFFLHAASNLFVVLFGLKDVLTTLDQPAKAMSGVHSWSAVPGGFVAAIHIYHCIAFELKEGDLFHHLAFALVGCTSNYFVNYGPLANFYFFFICGLPGGMDYFMLGLVKTGRMESMRQKAINTTINVWLRGPGLVMVYSFAMAAYRTGDHEINLFVLCALFFISPGNGQYYLERVCANYHFRLGYAAGVESTPADGHTGR